MFPLPGFTCGLTVAARRIRRTRRAPLARAHGVPPRRRPNLNTKWWVENGSSKGLRVSCIQFAASIAIASGVQ